MKLDYLDGEISSNSDKLKGVDFRVDTYSKSGPVTLAAYCKGVEIYSVTINVRSDD